MNQKRLSILIVCLAIPLHASVLDEDTGQNISKPTASVAPNTLSVSPTSVQSTSSASSVSPSESAVPATPLPSEQTPSNIAPKKKSKAPTTDLNSVPTAQSTAASAKTSDPYLTLAEALAQATGSTGRINVGIGNFVYEDTDLLSPYSAMLKDELGIALPKAGKFEVITRERLADLQNEGKFQAKEIVEPGTEAKKVQIEGVQGMIRGRFYYQPPNLTIYAEIAYLDGGEVRKVKIVVPANEVAARIWPDDAQKQSKPEVAIAPQAIKESTASVQDVESKVRKVQKDFPLEIHTVDGKRGYAEGETVSFRCRSGHDAYIAVIDHQIDGSEILLFPNAFSSENYIPAGKAIDVPGTVKHGFEIQISPPFGSDVVQVIACTRKQELEKITSSFPSSTQANPYAVRTRGMKVVAVDEAQKNTSMETQPPQWSEDHIVVSTYPKIK
jgi:curli biogenesis system outer membrane secretion channel CsgG